MKIAIIGYGKMGHAVERVALQRGHTVVSVIDVDNASEIDSDAFAGADVAIEFSTPSTAAENVVKALGRDVAVVCGSTGWAPAGLPDVKKLVDSRGGSFIWSSNYSLGVNLFFKLNGMLASMMERFAQYNPSIKEVHHIHKLDHPSGTAVSLAGDIINRVGRISKWTEDAADAGSDRESMLIAHERVGEVPGTHSVVWSSPVDVISIEHRALSRDGFALGAVVAAEWLHSHPGYHTMDDLMDALTGNEER